MGDSHNFMTGSMIRVKNTNGRSNACDFILCYLGEDFFSNDFAEILYSHHENGTAVDGKLIGLTKSDTVKKFEKLNSAEQEIYNRLGGSISPPSINKIVEIDPSELVDNSFKKRS